MANGDGSGDEGSAILFAFILVLSPFVSPHVLSIESEPSDIRGYSVFIEAVNQTGELDTGEDEVSEFKSALIILIVVSIILALIGFFFNLDRDESHFIAGIVLSLSLVGILTHLYFTISLMYNELMLGWADGWGLLAFFYIITGALIGINIIHSALRSLFILIMNFLGLFFRPFRHMVYWFLGIPIPQQEPEEEGPRCEAITNRGHRCSYNAGVTSVYCTRHRCEARIKLGERCGDIRSKNSTYCDMHTTANRVIIDIGDDDPEKKDEDAFEDPDGDTEWSEYNVVTIDDSGNVVR